jgi:hypothetical protein
MLGFFKPVVDKIIKLLKDQINRASREADCRINVREYIFLGCLAYANELQTILLVGGFGDSPYLLDVLKKWCKENENIRVFCPPHP